MSKTLDETVAALLGDMMLKYAKVVTDAENLRERVTAVEAENALLKAEIKRRDQ